MIAADGFVAQPAAGNMKAQAPERWDCAAMAESKLHARTSGLPESKHL